jgi:hypothetical protein
MKHGAHVARVAGERAWRLSVRVFVARAIGLLLIALAIAPSALGQDGRLTWRDQATDAPESTGSRFTSRADSLDWERKRARAARSVGFRLVISLLDRRLWAIIGSDTLLSAPVAVASGATLEYQGRQWAFSTPRGIRRVVRKDSVPVWIPPEWHYYEVARAHGLVVRHLMPGRPVELDDGRRLELRGDSVGLVTADSSFAPLDTGAEIIFDGFLFIPPLETAHRKVTGELGMHSLDLGQGFLLHGTPYQESIGQPTTHGCIRLRDADIAWLYEMVPIGTKVYIY